MSVLALARLRLARALLARSRPAALLRASAARLAPAVRAAARASPAYAGLLREAGVAPAELLSAVDVLQRAPVLDKATTFGAHDLRALLARRIGAGELGSLLTSSGHGSATRYGLGASTRREQRARRAATDLGLDLAFSVASRRTLLINALPMGVSFDSDLVCVANVSVREDMVGALMAQAAPLFEQVVLVGDPLFLKRLTDHGRATGIDWRRRPLHVIVGEESMSETARDYLAAELGIEADASGPAWIGSSFGVAELGLNLLHESRASVRLRRACRTDPALRRQLLGDAAGPLPQLMHWNPLAHHIEAHAPDRRGHGWLVVTALDRTATLPLPRYRTGDRVQCLPPARVAAAWQALAPGLAPPPLPLLALHGRHDDALAGGVHLDHYKSALYADRAAARQLSGAFRVEHDGAATTWRVQRAAGSSADTSALAAALAASLAPELPPPPAPVRVVVQDHLDFGVGLTFDYERKFRYRAG